MRINRHRKTEEKEQLRRVKHKKLWCILLSAVLVFALMPGVPGGSYENIAYAASGWQPRGRITITSAAQFPFTITNGQTVQINGTINYTASSGQSPITIAANATASLIINGSVTLNGANASGTTGATAAISVPESSTLTIYSAHDEQLSTVTSPPVDTLTLKGGNAAAGGNGGKARREYFGSNIIKTFSWYTGAGGDGGGGAAAAIGGNGGDGGSGGARYQSPVEAAVMPHGKNMRNGDDHSGAAGNDGKDGSKGAGAGKIYISGRLNLNATGGSAAGGGNGGTGCGGYSNTVGGDSMIGGCGGGGGGGGGLAAPAIGAGGAGGSGGGSGGELSSDCNGDVQGCGGGGGAGGWPNGGGGGGGGAECSKALNEKDNTSAGGAGGAGGAAGQKGNSGQSGVQTGTSGHGLNDARPGGGGSGGSGLSSATTAIGGGGGKEKDNKYNGGRGGYGGGYVAKKSWSTQGNLIFSTANKLNLSSPLSNDYGDGQGYGTQTGMTPYIIYDLMDCKVTLSSCTYPGTDNSATTKIVSITYSTSTDRDGSTIGSARTLSSSRAKIESYSGLRHYNTGQAKVTGNNEYNRTTVMADQSIIGSKTENFTITKASLADVSISGDVTNVTAANPVTFNLTRVYVTATKSLDISELCKNSAGTKGNPTISWSISKGSGNLSRTTGTSTTFTPTSSGAVQITMKLSGMNDFNDYTETISFSVGTTSLTAEFSTDTPHPRKDITVILPSDLGDAEIEWFSKGVSVCTDKTYTVKAGTSGETLTVKVTPKAANSKYSETTFTVPNQVEAHDYTDNNGFCKICDEYQPPDLFGSSRFLIKNGGNMFWFAALINNDGEHAYFTTSQSNIGENAVALIYTDIDLEGSKGREWTPINNFKGSIFGQKGATDESCEIKDMRISGEYLRTGLIANAEGATIDHLTVEGIITLPEKNCQNIKNSAVGGVVGFFDGGTVTSVISKVTIENEGGGVYKHVGGIIGEIQNKETTVTKSLFEGDIHLLNSDNCIGGIVGYSNSGARISYCANLGSVVTDKDTTVDNPYTGGILGYLNNADVTVKNCYNYGTVDNGGGNHAGAIIGWCRNNTDQASRFADNYYLSGSADVGIGRGSTSLSGTAAPGVRSKAAFRSGEVCYLVNGKTSDGRLAKWRQNIDNGKESSDYPLFLMDILGNAISHSHSDGYYSNYPERISVNISWGAMAFTYSDGTWNPELKVYENPGWTVDEEDGDKVTVTNNSNVSLNAKVSFTPNLVYQQQWKLTGNFGLGDTTGTLLSRNGGAMTTRLTLDSEAPSEILAEQAIGTIKVKISTI